MTTTVLLRGKPPSALCSEAEPAEAALLGNIVASITIKQIGATGTASPAQVREQFERLGRSGR